jgi:adenylate cyclase
VRVEPLPRFQGKGAHTGIASVLFDPDATVRRVPAYADGFAAALLKAAGRGEAPVISAGALMQVFGPARTYETVSYYQALKPAEFLPEDFFRDRVVIVGLSMQSAPTIDEGGADAYATSWTARSRRLTPGAEIQATIYDNLAGRVFVMQAPGPVLLLATLVAALLGSAAVWRGTSWRTVVTAIAVVAVTAAASFILLQWQRFYMTPIAPSLAFAAVASIQAARDYAAERRLRRTITRAFSQYVSPVIVERLAADPRQLKLGGERRTLTILFCDVRGFTTISEQMKDDPEGLTLLINRLLNPLSDVILKAGGTIDKYIGDAIMAFWNAPLDDPDHAVHAIRAAEAMIEAVEKLNADRIEEARGTGVVPAPLKIGVGVNTGPCVVGNLGSDFRFNYSALGDAVNLAARLEGETKGYGVSILVGEETARAVEGRVALAELDRVKVKGKNESVAISTPVPGGEALERHRAFVADFYGGAVKEDDPRFEAIPAELPQLAGYYQTIRRRAGAAEVDPSKTFVVKS